MTKNKSKDSKPPCRTKCLKNTDSPFSMSKKVTRKSKKSSLENTQDNGVGSEGSMAMSADRHVCYAQSVQAADAEVLNLINMRKQISSSLNIPLALREDFCGTAVLSLEWCTSSVARTAYGIDNDTSVLSYAKKHTLATAETQDAASRVNLVHGNVLTPRSQFKTRIPRVDIIAALNYGICYFRTRKELVEYLCICKDGLKKGGCLIVDMYGGSDVYSVKGRTIIRKLRGFDYIFEQTGFNPMTNTVHINLHFHFKDNSWQRNAFQYDFRVWTIPEVREAFHDAGFEKLNIWVASSSHSTTSLDDLDGIESGGEPSSGEEEKENGAGILSYRIVESDWIPQLKRYNVYVVGCVEDGEETFSDQDYS
ncbi:hypothetical protein SeMB42_g05826 [Synchytrium endobioticum]|uniref:Methyltransferase domain-containing protein n=1 Tax=Synchytrium endobioticum TaxID=286115 RepID=A0A507CP13_9FUNG|nr:hypothetical protein SeMB42_g05826 [Synchytrium endobioticum]TPX43991.1 hypothetical protein SeLEV6574_g04775 [Synchytrium endobioticum]